MLQIAVIALIRTFPPAARLRLASYFAGRIAGGCVSLGHPCQTRFGGTRDLHVQRLVPSTNRSLGLPSSPEPLTR